MKAVREAGFHSMVTNFSNGVVSGVVNHTGAPPGARIPDGRI